MRVLGIKRNFFAQFQCALTRHECISCASLNSVGMACALRGEIGERGIKKEKVALAAQALG